jgi:hypothetical protein
MSVRVVTEQLTNVLTFDICLYYSSVWELSQIQVPEVKALHFEMVSSRPRIGETRSFGGLTP